MKKILIYLISFITICFILPAIFTNRTAKTSTNDIGEEKTTDKSSGETVVETTENTSTSEYEYQKYGIINLLHTSTGEVEQVKIDDYLCNVVSAEMPADFDNKALETQAIVARTYTVFKILNKKHQNADICDSSTCCQAWISKEDRLSRWAEDKRESNWEKIANAVKNTAGKIITYNNQPINAFFSYFLYYIFHFFLHCFSSAYHNFCRGTTKTSGFAGGFGVFVVFGHLWGRIIPTQVFGFDLGL